MIYSDCFSVCGEDCYVGVRSLEDEFCTGRFLVESGLEAAIKDFPGIYEMFKYLAYIATTNPEKYIWKCYKEDSREEGLISGHTFYSEKLGQVITVKMKGIEVKGEEDG